jgi:hypothetical protein
LGQDGGFHYNLPSCRGNQGNHQGFFRADIDVLHLHLQAVREEAVDIACSRRPGPGELARGGCKPADPGGGRAVESRGQDAGYHHTGNPPQRVCRDVPCLRLRAEVVRGNPKDRGLGTALDFARLSPFNPGDKLFLLPGTGDFRPEHGSDHHRLICRADDRTGTGGGKTPRERSPKTKRMERGRSG